MNASESDTMQKQGHAHVINGGRVVNQTKFSTESGVLKDGKVWPVSDFLPHQSGIAIENGFAVRVENCSVVNRGPTADHGVKHRVQVAVGAQIVGDAATQCLGISGIHARAAEVRRGIGGEISELGG